MNVSAWHVIRAVRGPVLLIAFGTLMAFSHTGAIGIGRTWPVLIIVFGLFTLLERMVERPVPVPPPWPPPPPPVSTVGTYVPPQYPPPPPQTYTPQQPEGGAQ